VQDEEAVQDELRRRVNQFRKQEIKRMCKNSEDVDNDLNPSVAHLTSDKTITKERDSKRENQN
jgi:hypothetical protein